MKTVGEPAFFGAGQLSRDEKKLAISIFDTQSRNRDIWIYGLTRGIRTRFTFDPGVEDFPVWSPDGRYLLYYTSGNSKTKSDLWALPLTGDPKPIPVLQTEFGEGDG